MNHIKILPKEIYSKIAAGEVVERPASIVRELIDNAIDAKSTEIIIDIEKGGLKKISVTDNGTGIFKDDLPLALSMHATSKINDINDLLAINTMGFRGEALHSIQTVSKITITTNTDDTGKNPGFKVQNYGKDKDKIIPTAFKKGTKVEVEEIFYNIPARMKFLKTQTSEWFHIKNTVIDKVFSALNVSFKLIHNKQIIFSTNGNEYFKEAFFSIFKNEDNFDIYKFTQKINDDITISLYHSPGEIFFSNRKYQTLFVNNRPVRVSFLNAAIDTAIRNYISPGRHPLIYIYININPKLIDVNIHPAKKEIKFINQNDVFCSIQNTIIQSFSKILKREIYGDNDYKKNEEKKDKMIQLDFNNIDNKFDYYNEVIAAKNKNDNNFTDQNQKIIKNYNILGVAFDTYIIVEKNNKILLIDQHAAAESIIFNMKKEKYKKTQDIEKLLVPIIFDLEKIDGNLEKKIDILNRNKFLIERSEGSTIKIRELPAILLIKKDYDYVIDIIKAFLEKEGIIEEDNIIDILLIEASCKEAVKKGDILTILEMAEIIDEFFKINKINCPHGRPIYFEISKEYLEKIFQRKK